MSTSDPSSSSSPPPGGMSSLDFQLCRDALATFMSQEHSSKNYLFLEPVDLTFFPNYTEIVKRPMDLGTLRANLESGRYRNRDSFFNDAMMCFENALAFNGGRKENQWIIKLAKDMMKLVCKEKKRADKKARGETGGGSGGGSAEDGGGSSGSGVIDAGDRPRKLSIKVKSRPDDLDGHKSEKKDKKSPKLEKGPGEKGEKKKKLKLKLSSKLPKSVGDVPGGENQEISSKLKLSSKLPKNVSDVPGGENQEISSSVKEPMKVKSEKKLKISSSEKRGKGEAFAAKKKKLALAVGATTSSGDSGDIKGPKGEQETPTSSSATPISKPKLSLKLKGPSAPSSEVDPSASLAADHMSQEKPKKKSKKKDKAQQQDGQKIKAIKAKPSKPKLKLTLSLSKKPKGVVGGDMKEKSKLVLKRDTPKDKGISSVEKKKSSEKTSSSSETGKTLSSSKKKSTPSTPKKETATTPSSSGSTPKSAPSRGKELPKGVKDRSTSPVGKEKASSVSSPASAPSKPSSKLKVRLSAPSRGKELPKGVAASSGGPAALSAGTLKKQETKKQETGTSKKQETSLSKKQDTGMSKKQESIASKKLEIGTSKKQESGTSKKQETGASKKQETGASKKQERPTSPVPAKKSRGKELPKGVVAGSAGGTGGSLGPTGVAKKDTSSTPSKKDPPTKTLTISLTQNKKTASKSEAEKPSAPPKQPATSSVSKPPPATTAPSQKPPTVQLSVPTAVVASMDSVRKAQCTKVLSGLKRRQPINSKWFLQPVNDPRLVKDYRAKIPFPMDLGSVTTKLEKDQYSSIAEFVLDVRRVFGNCLRYNTGLNDTFRPVAVEMLSTSEELLTEFVAKKELPSVVYPKLLYCWEICVSILDALLNSTNPTDGLQTATYFLHPVSFYCGGFPPDYLDKVKNPMDLGTITSKLMEGEYQSVGAFVADCRLVCENCFAYYSGREDGTTITEQATRLRDHMAQQLGALVRYDESQEGLKAKAAALTTTSTHITKPPKGFLHTVIQELRGVKYTDRFTKLTEQATHPFENPVNLSQFPDYLDCCPTPMDLTTVERKIGNGEYETPEDFEYDVQLIFKNCERYNVPKHNDHIVAMAKHCAKSFRKLFSSRMKALEGGTFKSGFKRDESAQPSSVTSKPSEQTKKEKRRSMSPTPDGSRPSKKARTENGSASKGGKSTTKMNVQSSTSSSSGKAPRSKSPKATGGSLSSTGGSKKRVTTPPPPKNDGAPVPLHVAIAQVKDSFPVRRHYKDLEPWEGACARFWRELMRHPWISATRPKFIFHVPVPILFPELKEAYVSKIEKPMDLTTAEAKLLHGGMYQTPQEFIDDIALVFANAIRFNEAGHDMGEPTSCAYFDVSRHLSRYSRWLSLEYLSPYLSDDSQAEEVTVEEGATISWKLTTANKSKAREEMSKIVLNAPIEKSEEGERYTWMESECEKLLKALRHQSDLRHMTFFIHTNYPADYAAYIAKPRDWEKCNRTLQKRAYHTFGDIVEDLRLIFSNALKYNARAKGTDTVSGRAYDAAVYMSAKLEVAIDKMMISVSDRLEREKIDQVISEREIEAAERAEEERLRAAWQKEREKAKTKVEVETKIETVETVKVIQRRPPKTKEMTDFEFPFFDEEEGHHEQSHMEALRQQKLIFEKQQKDREAMRKITLSAGMSVFERMSERARAIAWAEKMALESKAALLKNQQEKRSVSERDADAAARGSKVLDKLNENRNQIKITICKPKKMRKKKAPSLLLA